MRKSPSWKRPGGAGWFSIPGRSGEVEASWLFCGDHGPGKYHLSLNTNTDQYRCNRCGAHGNSVSLYARVKGISGKEVFRELSEEVKTYPFPQQPEPQNTERQPLPLEQRHAAYMDMLEHLTLLGRHRGNLLGWSFSGPAATNGWTCRAFVHTTANGPSAVSRVSGSLSAIRTG